MLKVARAKKPEIKNGGEIVNNCKPDEIIVNKKVKGDPVTKCVLENARGSLPGKSIMAFERQSWVLQEFCAMSKNVT